MRNVLIGLVFGLLVAGGVVFYFRLTAAPPAVATGAAVVPVAVATERQVDVATVKDSAQGAASQAGGQPLPLPLPLPSRPEIDALIESNPLLASYHAGFVKELRDPAWASAMEAKFVQAFDANVDLRRYGAPTAECRATQCEIRLLAFGVPTTDPKQWAQLLAKGIAFNPDAAGVVHIQEKPMNTTLATKSGDGVDAVVLHMAFSREASNK